LKEKSYLTGPFKNGGIPQLFFQFTPVVDQIDRFSFTSPIVFENQGKNKTVGQLIRSDTGFISRGMIEDYRERVGKPRLFEQTDLTGFTRIIKPGIIVGKDPGAILPGHLIQGSRTALGKNDGRRHPNEGQVRPVRTATGTEAIFIRDKAWVVR
jgi:hypothetical protein